MRSPFACRTQLCRRSLQTCVCADGNENYVDDDDDHVYAEKLYECEWTGWLVAKRDRDCRLNISTYTYGRTCVRIRHRRTGERQIWTDILRSDERTQTYTKHTHNTSKNLRWWTRVTFCHAFSSGYDLLVWYCQSLVKKIPSRFWESTNDIKMVYKQMIIFFSLIIYAYSTLMTQ